MDIRLITNTEELEGTWYFEFLPRTYEDTCWNADSVFLEEEAFGLVEKVFSKNIKNYDHYAFMVAGKAEITRVIEDLAELKRLVQQCQHVTEITSMVTVPEDMIHELKKNWELNKEKLITMIDDLSAWLTNHINKTGVISILGM